MKTSAFSLIELMVVIAIVAILAAVAAPAYQNYMISSRAASVVPIIEDIMDKSILFADTNGRFGNAYDLGLAASNGGSNLFGNADYAPAVALSPYFGGLGYAAYALQVGDYGGVAGSITPCGAVGLIVTGLDPTLLGYSQSEITNGIQFIVSCYYANFNGAIDKICFPTVIDNNGCLTGNLVPGWPNFYTDTSCDEDTAAYNSYVSFIQNSTCQ